MNELTIHLNVKSRTPLYEQIYTYIKGDIQNGRIIQGDKLPSTRSLSKYLEVSRSTVELAYEQLLSEGYIESVACKGYFVAQVGSLYHLRTVPVKAGEESSPKRAEYRYDLTPNGVDLKSFPYQIWRKLSKDILQDDQTALFRSGDSQGEYTFRNAICNYLYQARGVHGTPDQVIIGAGSDYLLMLLGTVLGRQHQIAVENPAYKQAYRLFRSQSYEVVPVSMDRHGMKVGELKASAADIAYVTPSHQYPTGIVMPIKRRMELLEWANEKDGRYIIEDDYDSEFRYKGKPIPALQGFDAQDKVIYLGTFSKSIAPAIRLSYMVLPKSLLQTYRETCGFLNSTVSKVDQEIVRRFIEEGYYERHLNKMRALYKNRHDLLIAGLRPLAARCKMSGEHAGVHLLLTFEGGITEEALIRSAGAFGVKVYGLSDFIIQEVEHQNATVLLGFANLSDGQIAAACEILCQVWPPGSQE